VLATVGIYGLVSYSVTQRAYEIALRMAIGATAAGVLRMIMMQILRVSLAGLCAGIVGALLLGRGVSALLFEVAPADPVIYALVSALLLAVSVIAALIPALRASRIDPVRILRAE
jgi:ABC-type antimicrobial peptide transport system permease subunit